MKIKAQLEIVSFLGVAWLAPPPAALFRKPWANV